MRRVLCSVLVTLCAIPTLAAAHGSGASLERVAGEYFIDIGYDPVQVMAGDRMVLDFSLADARATSTPTDFDYVWVRMHAGSRTLLATGIHRAGIGPTTLLYALPSDIEGDLSLSVRYQRDDDVLAEAEFTLPVAPHNDPRWWWPLAGIGLAAMILCAGFTTALRWKTRRNASDTI